MYNLKPTKRFTKALKKLDPQSRNAIKEALSIILSEGLEYPSLRVKKMEGYHNPDIWEARANVELRITFEYEKPDTIILRNCGHHDKTLKNP